MRPIIIYILLGLFMYSCSKLTPEIPTDDSYKWELPAGFPVPAVPDDNQMSEKRVALGKKLFYDPVLSIDSTVSCGSCHKTGAGLADNRAISPGIHGRLSFRNAPTLANVAYHPYFFKEGGSPSLELQALGPIENEDEMGFNAAALAQRIKYDPTYNKLAQDAYGRNMDLFVLVRAIASFERTMISGNAPYDQYINQDSSSLTPAQLRGMDLFFSEKTACSNCHKGFDFTAYTFENNGLYDTFEDKGRQRITLAETDIGKFKVPTLRNIALTAPYMHDGSFPTLEAVIDHYRSGGKGHINQSQFVRPFELAEQEKKDLIHFLHALTDNTFIQNPAFRP